MVAEVRQTKTTRLVYHDYKKSDPFCTIAEIFLLENAKQHFKTKTSSDSEADK